MPYNDPNLSLLSRLRRAPAQLFHWLAGVGAMIVAPLDRAALFVVRRVVAGFEWFEKIETALLWLARPFVVAARGLGALLDAIGRILIPAPVRRAAVGAAQRCAGLMQWLWQRLAWLVERLNLDGPLLKIVQWLRPVWYPFAALGGFCFAWLSTRPYRQLVWGLPAMLMLLPVLAAVCWSVLWGRESVATQYRAIVQQALDEKDYPKMQLFERKLAQLGIDTRLTEFRTAIALAENDKLDEAYERMQKLAPLDDWGYPPAYFWIIQRLVSGQLDVPADEAHQLLQAHLEQIRIMGFGGQEFKLLNAFWLAQDGQTQAASNELASLIHVLPEAAMLRIQIDLSLGNMGEARRDARAVRSHMQDRERSNYVFTGDELRMWAVAEELLGDLIALQSVVERWLELEPDNSDARKMLAACYLRAFQEGLRRQTPNDEQLAKLFVETAEYSGDPQAILEQAAALFADRDLQPTIQRVADKLAQAPKTPPNVLQALGIGAARAGDMTRAAALFRRMTDENPNNAAAWNNYAWALYQCPEPDLEAALAAVAKALEMAPDNPSFRETRGQILVAQASWKSAVVDLEFALNAMPDSTTIHKSLAVAYDALGDEQLAAIHREYAK